MVDAGSEPTYAEKIRVPHLGHYHLMDLYTKLPSQHLMLGHHLPASETPFQWRFEMALRWRADDGLVKRYLDPQTPIS